MQLSEHCALGHICHGNITAVVAIFFFFLKSDFIHHVAHIPPLTQLFMSSFKKGKKKFVYVNLNS